MLVLFSKQPPKKSVIRLLVSKGTPQWGRGEEMKKKKTKTKLPGCLLSRFTTVFYTLQASHEEVVSQGEDNGCHLQQHLNQLESRGVEIMLCTPILHIQVL